MTLHELLVVADKGYNTVFHSMDDHLQDLYDAVGGDHDCMPDPVASGLVISLTRIFDPASSGVGQLKLAEATVDGCIEVLQDIRDALSRKRVAIERGLSDSEA